MNKTEETERAPSEESFPWLGPALLMMSLAILAEAAHYWWPHTVDDAFITFRYAQNLVEGLGPVYNPGERVEGYSSPIWMLGSAIAIAVGADPVVSSKWAGLLAAGALSVAVYIALRASSVSNHQPTFRHSLVRLPQMLPNSIYWDITAGYIMARYITAGYITQGNLRQDILKQGISWQGILPQGVLRQCILW